MLSYWQHQAWYCFGSSQRTVCLEWTSILIAQWWCIRYALQRKRFTGTWAVPYQSALVLENSPSYPWWCGNSPRNEWSLKVCETRAPTSVTKVNKEAVWCMASRVSSASTDLGSFCLQTQQSPMHHLTLQYLSLSGTKGQIHIYAI